MLYYLDTSILAAHLLGQGNVSAIRASLNRFDHGELAASSQLLDVELHRLCIREGLSSEPFDQAIAVIALSPVSQEIIRRAKTIPFHVKSLDAIHLATCEYLQATMLTVDRKMASLAQQLGMPVETSLLE